MSKPDDAALDRPPGAQPIPAALEQLRLDLLAKDPAKRPADVADVRRRLLDALEPEPVQAAESQDQQAGNDGSSSVLGRAWRSMKRLLG